MTAVHATVNPAVVLAVGTVVGVVLGVLGGLVTAGLLAVFTLDRFDLGPLAAVAVGVAVGVGILCAVLNAAIAMVTA